MPGKCNFQIFLSTPRKKRNSRIHRQRVDVHKKKPKKKYGKKREESAEEKGNKNTQSMVWRIVCLVSFSLFASLPACHPLVGSSSPSRPLLLHAMRHAAKCCLSWRKELTFAHRPAPPQLHHTAL